MRNAAFKGREALERIKQVEDFLNPEGDAFDDCGHGIHCAGLLRKVAPEANIYIARVAKDGESNLNVELVAKVCVNTSYVTDTFVSSHDLTGYQPSLLCRVW
jgi:hypothetical protein